MTLPVFTLYGTSACHLCEQAEALFGEVVPAAVAQLELVDVSATEALMECYGLRIPVLAGSTANARRELSWPFDAVALGEFVDAVLDDI
ncbi:MAG TPA: glutaredoxin family protein [Hyphomicrobiales bacterium]|nr:glutaredoxin family protein [Hyphomicrobiales bacterium]